MIGAVTMKITSSTNITSTSGVTLICAMVAPLRWDEESMAIVTSQFQTRLYHMLVGEQLARTPRPQNSRCTVIAQPVLPVASIPCIEINYTLYFDYLKK